MKTLNKLLLTGAAIIGIAGYIGCGPSPTSNNNNKDTGTDACAQYCDAETPHADASNTNNALGLFDQSTFRPLDGSSFTGGNPKPKIKVKTPDNEADPEGDVRVVIEVDGNSIDDIIGKGGDTTQTTFDFTQDCSGPCPDGNYDITATFTAVGQPEPNSRTHTISINYQQIPSGPVVTGLEIIGANVNVGFAARAYGTHPSGATGLIGEWNLTSDMTGASISDVPPPGTGSITAPGQTEARGYNMTVWNGTSPQKTFYVPVSEMETRMIVECLEGTNHDLLTPDRILVKVGKRAVDQFVEGSLPTRTGQPDYVRDAISADAVYEALTTEDTNNPQDTVTAAEHDQLELFQANGTFIDLYQSPDCTVDNVQLVYRHD